MPSIADLRRANFLSQLGLSNTSTLSEADLQTLVLSSTSYYQKGVSKTSDQVLTTNSTVLQNDPDFVQAVRAGDRWFFEITAEVLLAVGGGTGTDLKYKFVVPSGTTGNYGSAWVQPGTAGTQAGFLNDVSVVGGAALAEGTQGVVFKGIFDFTADGNVQIQWAQNAANAAAITILKQSMLVSRRLKAGA